MNKYIFASATPTVVVFKQFDVYKYNLLPYETKNSIFRFFKYLLIRAKKNMSTYFN